MLIFSSTLIPILLTIRITYQSSSFAQLSTSPLSRQILR